MKIGKILEKHRINKIISRDFGLSNYIVQYETWIGTNCILYCICGEIGYAEIVLENVRDFKNKELIWSNKIMLLESISMEKSNLQQYTIVYQGTPEVTRIFAENVKWYHSSYFLCRASRYAISEWASQGIGLPSIMIALLMLESDTNNKFFKQIRDHIYTLSLRKSYAESGEVQICEWNQEYYILASQCILKEVAPFSERYEERNLDTLLIERIEENKLMRFDP